MEQEATDKLERLEAHITHLDRQFDELNQVVVEHTKLLKKLQLQQSKLADSVQTSESERIRATNPKPPHYQ